MTYSVEPVIFYVCQYQPYGFYLSDAHPPFLGNVPDSKYVNKYGEVSSASPAYFPTMTEAVEFGRKFGFSVVSIY